MTDGFDHHANHIACWPPSGAAGLAGLLAASERGLGPDLGLTRDATVLLLVTEGATDPGAYRSIVGA